MSSLCRLSSGSQFCLGQPPAAPTGRPVGGGGHRTEDNGSISSSCCARGGGGGGSSTSDIGSWERVRGGGGGDIGIERSPLSLSTLSGQTPDSIRRRELDSGHTDALSRNTSFMISLMDICNKMILPLAALQQDCATCASADAAAAASAAFAAAGAAVANAAESPDANCSRLASIADTTCGGGGGSDRCLCRCRCRHAEAAAATATAAAAAAAAAAKKKTSGRPQLPTTAAAFQQTNQHQPTDRCGPPECGGGVGGQNNANSSAKKKKMKPPLPPTPPPPPPPPPPPSPRPSAAAVNEVGGGCVINDPALAAAELQPLLKQHDVPFWNAAEFQDFRASAPAPTQQLEPMLDPGRHRHMIILDSHYRLKAAIAGFHAPVYRPY